MRSKKTKIVVIMAIIILIAVIAITTALVLLGTDITKSNKEMFFKHAIGFVNDEQEKTAIEEYYKKMLSTPFESSTTYSTNINDRNEVILSNEEQEILNNTSIELNGKSDLANKIAEENVNIEYSNDINIPFIIKMTQDYIAYQSDYIGKKYIATNNDIEEYIKEFTNKDIESEKVKQLTVELKELINQKSKTYINAIMNSVDDSKFTKINENNKAGYKAVLTDEDLKNSCVVFLTTLKNDQEMINKINELIDCMYADDENSNSEILTQDSIDEYISNLQGNNINSDNTNSEFNDDINEFNNESTEDNTNLEGNQQSSSEFIITVLLNGKEANQITVEREDTKIQVSKNNDNNNVNYTTSIESGTDESTINAHFKMNINNYNGTETEEIYELGYEYSEIAFTHTLTRNLNFVESIETDQISDEDILNIDDMESEQKQQFMTSVSNRIAEVNKMQMEQLGSRDENLLIYEIPFMGIIESFFSGFTNNTEDSIKNMEIDTFNQKFEVYSGNEISGSKINALIKAVTTNNEQVAEHKVRIGVNVEDWNYDTNQADTNKQYKVTYEKDEEGYINSIKIED